MAVWKVWLLVLLPLFAGQAQFVDVAGRSEFPYVTNNGFDGKRKYFPQPLCGGVAVLDFDNDGLLDLYFTNGAGFPDLRKSGPAFHHALLRNKGDGVFEDVTARAGLTGESLGYSLGAAAGDFDNDGHTDLLVANAGGPNTLYRNQGDGTFADVTARAGLAKPEGTLSVQGAWFDYDRDGLLDLVLSNYTVWTAATDKRCVREDGVDFWCHPKTYPAVPHRLYRNRGEGRFEDVTEASGFGKVKGKGMGIAIVDFNGDNWPDVFIANDTEPNFLYVNRGDGTFAERALALGVAYDDAGATVSAMGADARDYDNDGFPDVFYNNLIEQVWGLFRNLGGRSFRYAAPPTGIARLSARYSGWSAGFIDYNNDGWLDLYSANGDVDRLREHAAQHDTLFENQGGKRFVDVSGKAGEYFRTTGYQRGSAFADLNNDGWMDIVVTSLGRRPAILLNGGGEAHWIGMRLMGTRSNRDAIGARVRVTTASGRVLNNHLSPSVGFLSSSTKQMHFGLGGESRVAEIAVQWPSGVVSKVHDLAADQVIVLTEPEIQ